MFGSSHSTDQKFGDGPTSTSQVMVKTTPEILLLQEPSSPCSDKVSTECISTRTQISHGNARLLEPIISLLTVPETKSELVNSKITMNSGPHGEEEPTTAVSTLSLSLMVIMASSADPLSSMILTELASLAVLSKKAARHAPMAFALLHQSQKSPRRRERDMPHTEAPRERISAYNSNES